MTPRPQLDNFLRAALDAVNPHAAVLRHVRVNDRLLRVGDVEYDLARFDRAVVVGAGKASAPMAAGVEELLAEHLSVEGTVTVKYGHTAPTRHVKIREAGHPVPDAAGVAATREIAEILKATGERDLVICVISGGGSALLTLPAEPLTLEDVQRTTDALLRCGASINEINVVRKHLDVVKGGGLARLAAPATLITLVLSDVVGNPMDIVASGPTVPDTSTFEDAAQVFDRYGLWADLPRTVVDRIHRGQDETPKPGDSMFREAQTVLIGSNLMACEAAARAAQREGLNTLVLTTFVEGEARQVAKVLAGVLREVATSGYPLRRPCLIVAGGETTVTLKGKGRGGRNQELALSAAFSLRGVPDVVLASIGTDGNDGPTDAAGAWVDGTTLERAVGLGLSAASALAHNDSYTFFDGLGDLIRTGPTNTNVNDVYLLFAP